MSNTSGDIIVKLKFDKKQLNRGITFNSFINKNPVFWSILYNKKTSPIQFQFENTKEINGGNTVVSMHRNLAKSKFCHSFFNVDTKQDEFSDFQNMYVGLKSEYEQHIFKFFMEKLYLTIGENKPSNNYLLVSGWKMHGYEDDLIFYFVQRRCYNPITRNNIIRTAGIQFANQRGIEALDKFFDVSSKKYPPKDSKKLDNISFLNTDSDLDLDYSNEKSEDKE